MFWLRMAFWLWGDLDGSVVHGMAWLPNRKHGINVQYLYDTFHCIRKIRPSLLKKVLSSIFLFLFLTQLHFRKKECKNNLAYQSFCCFVLNKYELAYRKKFLSSPPSLFLCYLDNCSSSSKKKDFFVSQKKLGKG